MADTELDEIHHIALPVHDLDQAVQWYTTSCTCRVIQQDSQQAILAFRNIRLSLVLPSFQQPHLAFVREDASTLGELRPQIDGSRSTFIADVSGNLVEIIDANSISEEPAE